MEKLHIDHSGKLDYIRAWEKGEITPYCLYQYHFHVETRIIIVLASPVKATKHYYDEIQMEFDIFHNLISYFGVKSIYNCFKAMRIETDPTKKVIKPDFTSC